MTNGRDQPCDPVRQAQPADVQGCRGSRDVLQAAGQPARRSHALALSDRQPPGLRPASDPASLRGRQRSEEHTSELQSQFHLVCRLLLEKKKNKYISSIQINKKPHSKKKKKQNKHK